MSLDKQQPTNVVPVYMLDRLPFRYGSSYLPTAQVLSIYCDTALFTWAYTHVIDMAENGTPSDVRPRPSRLDSSPNASRDSSGTQNEDITKTSYFSHYTPLALALANMSVILCTGTWNIARSSPHSSRHWANYLGCIF